MEKEELRRRAKTKLVMGMSLKLLQPISRIEIQYNKMRYDRKSEWKKHTRDTKDEKK